MAQAFRCSDAARERGDPLVGTAPPQARMLLVEQDGGWLPDAVDSLPVPDDVREELRSRATATGTRLMLIRRPGRQSSSVCMMRSWCVVDLTAPAGQRVTWGTWAYPTELLGAMDLVEELARDRGDRGPTVASADGAAPRPAADDDPLILVCTHGKKDVCCAVRGRPVAAALAARWPEQTWECSHTGGDRFAANLILLPDGATYGGLDPDLGAAVVESHLAGRPRTDHLRGQAGATRVEQAALVAAYRELSLPWGALRPAGRRRAEGGVPEEGITRRADALAATGEVVARWEVGLAVEDGRRLTVTVTEHLRPAAPLTCSATAPRHSRVATCERLERTDARHPGTDEV